ncbi:hypothetical protein HELRODRAFT_194111 [Helobdella robusta]|uniref:CUB domain-containing protein n=1 Tax=Helobdella robusta TaxID=6412 RepID=T1FVP6_HELRO|nr:hypothetical protein HELRODRAFT_194111 [Helobdella robusta]ESN93284.1 hypothetical protein HELRODRAFT_194111 [Helobdella robusta]
MVIIDRLELIDRVLTCSFCFVFLLGPFITADANKNNADLYGADLTEFCQSEKFQVGCSNPDEVIYVTYAASGIIQGKCYSNNFGQIGCFDNVTDYMNYKCAGQKSCSFKISDDEYLDELFKKCMKEFKRALFIKHECIKVDKSACTTCSEHRTARLSYKSGFLSSLIADETKNGIQCGSYKCPWSFVVSPGQRINISIHDYTGFILKKNSLNKYNERGDCLRLMTIREKSNPKDVEVCGGGGVIGHRQVYLSTSNSVEMYINVDGHARGQQFIVHYEASGCPDIIPTQNMWMNRKVDKLEVGCLPSDSSSWEMVCVNNEWKGTMGSCDPSDPLMGSVFSKIGTSMSSFFSSLPFGILLAGVLAIIIILSVCILTVGYVCYKKSHHQMGYKRRPQSISGDQYIDLNDPNNLLVQKVIVGKTMTCKGGKGYNYANTTVVDCGPNENKYAGRAMMMANQMIQSGGGVRPLPSIPDLRGTGANTNHRGGGVAGGAAQPPRMMIRSYGDGVGMGVRPPGAYPHVQGGIRPDQQQQHEYYVIEDRNRMNNMNMMNNNTGSSAGNDSDSFPPPPDLLFPADSTQGSLMRPHQQQQQPQFSQQQLVSSLAQQQQQINAAAPTYKPPMTLSSALKQQNNTYENQQVILGTMATAGITAVAAASTAMAGKAAISDSTGPSISAPLDI